MGLGTKIKGYEWKISSLDQQPLLKELVKVAKREGYSHGEIARQIGCRREDVKNVMSGYRRIGLARLEKIAKVLGLKLILVEEE